MKYTINDYTQHTLNDSSARTHEHETLFSFINDIGNYAFNDWWFECGSDAYNKYVEENLQELNERYS